MVRPTRVAAAAAAVAAAAASVAVGLPVDVPTSSRAFFKAQLGGTYTRFIQQGNCPVTITHTDFSEPSTNVVNVPFSNILMGGAQCMSAGSMVVVPNTDNTLTGLLSTLLQSNEVLRGVYSQLVDSGARFLVGFESVDRVCGPTTFRAPTVTFFVSEPEGLSVPRVAFLRPNFRPYMMVFKTNSADGIPCTYAKGQRAVDVGTMPDESDDDDDDDDDAAAVPATPVVVPTPVNPADTSDVDELDDDNDGLPDPSDPDDDNDGLNDNDDADNDGDGIADINDVPRNNGTDTDEGAPIVPVFGGEDIDSPDDDNDGLRDPVDPDDDNDGRPDNADANNDGDGVPDVADTPRNDGMDDGEGAIVVPVTGDAGDTDEGNDGAGVVPVADEGDDDDTDVAGVDDTEPSPSDDDSVCFPASAEVELDTGRTVRMDELAIGDNVRVSAHAFSRVFLFTHKLAAGSFNFVRLTTASAASLTVTRSHYVYANGKMTAAGAVKVGDTLELVGASKCDVVTTITPVTETGLFNPQTLHGDIVVNGIRASTFTTAVEPAVASALLAPLRALFRATGVSTSALDAGAARLAALLPRGASVY